MKKILLTLLTTCIMFTTAIVNLNAEEAEITKDYLKNTLNMTDEEIIGAGLGFVYDVGDELMIPMKATEDILSGSSADEFTIAANTEWEMNFVVADKGKDNKEALTLISTDALPIGKVSIDDGTNVDGVKYENNWIHSFLNEKAITMFSSAIQDKLVPYYRASYDLTNNAGILVDLKDANVANIPVTTSNIKLWIPSCKELGLGTTYTVNEGACSNINMPVINSTLYANFAENPNSTKATLGEEEAYYWLRESFYTGSNAYFLCTGEAGLSHANRNTGKNAVIIGFDVKWSSDTQNKVKIDDAEGTTANSVSLQAYKPATYEVCLPESVTLTDGYTQFKYTVKGDLEKNNIVKVEFPQTSNLKFTGGFKKDDITLNIFNEKVSFNRADCAKQSVSTVTIKNEVPTAGTWEGNLPVTISFQ